MWDRPIVLTLLASVSVLGGYKVAVADGTEHHADGAALLAPKLRRDGIYWAGKAGADNVVAEIRNGRVVAMSAGRLALRRVKARRTMIADLANGDARDGVRHAAFDDQRVTQTAQAELYGYCLQVGADNYCYWYPAANVAPGDGWSEYLPNEAAPWRYRDRPK